MGGASASGGVGASGSAGAPGGLGAPGSSGAPGCAGALLAAEICAPLLLLCWLCCWPDDASDTSSGKHPTRPDIIHESGSRAQEPFARRFGSSAVSLHLPSTSGTTKPSLSAHRSHEEIRSQRQSHLDAGNARDAGDTRDAWDARSRSAPSVIHEVLHRRDWERSTKELRIPLRPDGDTISLSKSDSPESNDCHQSEEQIAPRICKKHYTNIKCSKKKEADDDIKDDDVTEMTSFYIGDNDAALVSQLESHDVPEAEVEREENRMPRAKESKQSLNESIKCKERMKQTLGPVEEFKVSRFEDAQVEMDRSGAVRHSVESRSSLRRARATPAPPPSVEAVGYDSDASYLEEPSPWALAPAAWGTGAADAGWGVAGAGGADAGWGAAGAGDAWAREEALARGRHASAGDVLAPARRPQSGALSESELEWELEAPPAHGQLQLLPDRKETAI